MARREARSLTGRVVAITGGARGIGRTTAETLTRQGARVAIGDLDAELTERVAGEIGGDTVGLPLDVTNLESFERFLDEVESRLGPLDVLVNNAGIMPLGDFAEEDEATTTRILDINVRGVITGTRSAIRRMRPRRTGHVVNIASMAGKVGIPGGATYVASKHAVVGLTAAVAAENAEYGIEFTTVMPVVVRTELAAGVEESRGVKPVGPEKVAEAIVDALHFPRRDVYVPREVAAIHKFSYVLPVRAQEMVSKALKGDRVLIDIDRDQRAAYEARAARSEPGLEPEAIAASEPKPKAPSASAPQPETPGGSEPEPEAVEASS